MPQFTSFDGATLHYDEHGTGPPLVLLPGIGGTARMWGRPPSPITDNYRLLLPDPRGIGRSRGDGLEASLEGWGRDVLALLDALELETAHVLGVSLGSIMAVQAASRAPERLRSLVLVTPVGRLTPHQANFLHCLKALAQNLPHDLFMRAFCTLSLSPDSIDRNPKFVDVLSQVIAPDDVPALVEQCDVLLRGFDLLPLLPSITADTLLVGSRDDRITPLEYAEEMAAALPAARTLRLKDCGHAPLVEQPQAVIPALMNFWRQFG